MSVQNCHSPVRTVAQINGVHIKTSISPKVNKSFLERGTVALTVSLTNRFLKELKVAHEESDLSYIDIVNSQTKCFQLINSERLESRFFNKVHQVASDLKSKFKTGAKRYDYLKRERDIAVYDHELCDVNKQSCTLDTLESKSFEVEKRCAHLLSTLQTLTDENFQLRNEHSSAVISENSIRKKYESSEKERLIISKENKELQNTIEEHLGSICDMSATNTTLKKDLVSLKTTHTELCQHTSNLEKSMFKARKKYDDVRASNRSRTLSNLASEAEKALWFSETFGLSPKSIKFKSEENKEVTVKFDKKNYSQLDSDDKQNLRELLYVLDKFGISDTAYQELAMTNNSLPRSYRVVQERNTLNSMFVIERTPGEKPGAYVSIRNEIQNYIRHSDATNTTPLKIKVSGDGTRVSRISNFVTFTLSFPDTDNSVSINNIKTIAVIKCKETYEELGICCQPIFQQFNDIANNPEIVVDGKTFSLDVIFNGDMKFIQLCLGLCGATGNYACPWCLVSKQERTDIYKEADFYDSSAYKRTLSQLRQNATTRAYGSKHTPLVHLEPVNIVPDELHLFLRISDVLLQNIIEDCRQLDKIALVEKRKADHLDRLVKSINECGVTFQTWVDPSGIAQSTSLTGGDYKKLFPLLPPKLVFIVNNNTYDETAFLIRELLEIQNDVNKGSDRSATFQRVQNWMSCFQGLSRKGRQGYDRVTPYMHCLLYHVPAFVERFGGIGNFSGQGVEKMNDQIKLIHQRRSNKCDQTIDELKTLKRMEYLYNEDCERAKHQYTKVDSEWWDGKNRDRPALKKRRIEYEIKAAHQTFEKENEKPISEMTIGEIKTKLKSLGIATKVRKIEKLREMLSKAATCTDG